MDAVSVLAFFWAITFWYSIIPVHQYLIFNNTWYYFTWYSKPVVQDWNWAASVCLIGSRQIPSVNLASSETWKSFLFNGSFKNYIAKLYKTVFFSSFVLIKYKSNQSCLFVFHLVNLPLRLVYVFCIYVQRNPNQKVNANSYPNANAYWSPLWTKSKILTCARCSAPALAASLSTTESRPKRV